MQRQFTEMAGKVSVIFPVGPGVAGAGGALHDLLGQTYGDLEVLAVLNGCLPEVREEFLSHRDSRLRVMDLGGEGRLLEALDLAVRESEGRWLARMDSDDRCAPDRIARQIERLVDGGCEVVSCGISLKGALGDGMQRYVDWVNGLDDAGKVSLARFIESPVVQPTVMLSKELFLEAGGYRRNGFAEDYDLWLRLLAREARFGKVKEELYDWYDRNDRLTRSDARFGRKKMLALKALALSVLPEVRECGVAIAGAGPTGKVLGRELKRLGINLHGYFEVSPKQIGGQCQGVPVAGPEDFGGRWREAVLLGAVGTGGGRETVRAMALAAHYREGRDFWSCC